MPAEERTRLLQMLGMLFDCRSLAPFRVPTIDEIELHEPRLAPPTALASSIDTSPHARASHTYGKAFRDIVRGLERNFRAAPDAVARPRTEEDVVHILDWANDEGYCVVPYGGGSSVVGGVEVRDPHRQRGVVSMDLGRLAGVSEVDPVSQTFTAGAGTYGPALSRELKEHGLALRHFPQSFEFSTLGGWIVTRAGGHFATLNTRIDPFVQALRVVTPTGRLATRALPSTGAGPDPNGLWIGSEGALGIVTAARMRAQLPPTHRASATVGFGSFSKALEALRHLSQSGLYPANARVLGKTEALINGVADGQTTLLLIGFESSDHAVDGALARALEIAAASGGKALPKAASASKAHDAGAAGSWKSAFIRAPYLRDAMVVGGVVLETFESAATWDRVEGFVKGVRRAAIDAATRECGAGICTVRITHAYSDGCAPYFTVLAPGKDGRLVEQWDAIKLAVSDAIAELGGTISHHHATGRDHAAHWAKERGDLHVRALRALKRELDPKATLNPGVLGI